MKKPTNPIRTIRLAAGLTQEEMAARVGIRQGGWSTLEARKSLGGVRLDTLRKIAKALGVGVELLIGGK